MPQRILLTGRPGVGKTTAIVRLAERCSDQRLAGFYTQEIRRGGRREGFSVTTLSGSEATLARVGFKSGARVGRYGVDVAGFERVVLPELARPCDLMLVDEIGKMECFSEPFIAAVRKLLDSDTPLIATVAQKGGGLIAEVKTRADVELIEVTETNRGGLPARIHGMVQRQC